MAGLAATSPDMYDTVDQYMDENNWYDVDIKSTLGLTDGDIRAIADIDGVEAVQAANTRDIVMVGSNENSYTTRVFAFLDENGQTPLNGFVLKEGRLPENSGECVIQKNAGRYADDTVNVGDTLTISEENTDYDSLADMVVSKELTIVGYVEAPMCIAIYAETSTVGSGSISIEIYTRDDYFDTDYFTDAYVTVSGARALGTFTDSYEDLVETIVSKAEELGEERSKLRTEEVKSQAQEQVDGLSSLLDQADTLTETGTELAEDSAYRLQENAAAAMMISGSCPALAQSLHDLSDAVASQLEESSKEGASSALKDGLQGLIDDARQQVDEIEDCSWIVNDRYNAYGFSTYKSNIAKVGALSKIFPAFFFLVALLVALTTMTRLVEENRTQIGTLKALGFSNGQILGEYLFYSLLFSVLGCALGLIVGFRLFPSVICSAYQMMYVIPDIVTPFRLSIAAWVAPVTILSIILAAVWSCWNEFRSVPAAAMRPKAPSAGKRIWLEHIGFIWKKLTFTQKVTMRNIFRYKKRFFMTVIGVAGCSALLLTGFGLKDSISDIVDKQYGQINAYDFVMVVEDESATGDNALLDVLDDTQKLSEWMPYAEETGYLVEDIDEKLSIVVPEDTTRSGQFISLRDRTSGEEYEISEDGVVMTEKLCESYGIKAGDTVTLKDEDGNKAEVTVTAVCENYISSYAYMSLETYKKLFGGEPEFIMVMCNLSDGEELSEITAGLLENSNVLYINSAQTLKESFADSIKSINGVIYVLILSAGLLCIIVLYNLTNVNICERKKELATTRVLGFHKRETQNYIFRETNILSFFGGFVGLFLGLWLHSFVIKTVEVEMVMFGRQVYFTSFLYAMAITVVFTLLVNLILRRQINKIDMVEAMKANE